jgi:hypothetical protein
MQSVRSAADRLLRTMRSYRLFLVNVLRHIEEERTFKALSDQAAKRIAAERRASRPAELWDAHRRIARWD